MARIDLRHVGKILHDIRGASFSIRDVTLRVPEGTTLVVLGPSGCGKTRLLRLIAGLVTPDAGEIRFTCSTRPRARGCAPKPQRARPGSGNCSGQWPWQSLPGLC